jgi:hypothetical protein
MIGLPASRAGELIGGPIDVTIVGRGLAGQPKDTMKTMILRWMAVSPVIAIVLTVVGCASLSSNGVLTLKRTQIFVSWKMTAYQQAFTGGSVTEAQAQRVTAAHQA